MLRFFRRIRQKLLFSDQTSKYLLYALGEILLVMVGILLALQVNNWNEDRKSQQELDNVLKTVLSDLQNDLPTVKNHIRWAETKIARIDSVVSGQLTEERLENCYQCITAHVWYGHLILPNKGYRMLAEMSSLRNARKDTLVNEVLAFYEIFEYENKVYDDLRFETTVKNAEWSMTNIDYTLEEWRLTTNFKTNPAINKKLLSNEENLRRMVLFQTHERTNLRQVLRFYERRGSQLKEALEAEHGISLLSSVERYLFFDWVIHLNSDCRMNSAKPRLRPHS